MKYGHPFLTPELDVLRSRQREALSALPNWVIERMCPILIPADRLPPDALIAEMELRRIATSYLDSVHRFIDHSRRSVHANEALGLLSKVQLPFDAGLEDVIGELERLQTTAVNDPAQFPEETPLMRKLVPLLIWADQLAGDYMDSRV